MTRISPLSTSILNDGKITFVCKVIINNIELTHENGLISASLRKEDSIDGKISATDFTLVLSDIPNLSIYYNPVYPTYPDILLPGAKVEVLMGYARYSGTGDRENLSNMFVQWFKMMTGVTSTYNYNAKDRTMSIGCYDKVEEMINKGDWNSVSFEYMTIPELLNVIANNPKMPPVLEANQIHNPIFSLYSENSIYPAFWSGDILKVGGFTRNGRSRLPLGWYPKEIDDVKYITKSLKKYNDYNILDNYISFEKRNNMLENSLSWNDSSKNGLANWWNQNNLSFYDINNYKYDGYYTQIISGDTSSSFFQTVDTSLLRDSNIVISGNIKAINGSYAFYVNDGVSTYTGDYYSNRSYSDMSSNFSINLSSDTINIGIIPSGLIEIKELSFGGTTSFYAPYGFYATSSGEISSKTGVTAQSSSYSNNKSFRICASGTSFISRELPFKTIISGEMPKNTITVDYIYNSPWSIPVSGASIDIILKNDIDKIELMNSIEISGTNSKWLYNSVNISDIEFSITSGNYISYSGFANKCKLGISLNENTSLSPIFIEKIRLFNNEIIGNPCFLDSNSDGIPDGYDYIKNDCTSIQIDKGDFLEMGQSLSIINTDYSFGCVKKQIDNIKPDKYSINGNFLSENIITNSEINGGAYAEISAYNTEDDLLWIITSPHISGFSDWNRINLNFETTTDVDNIEITLGLRNAKGKALFNDIKLFKGVEIQEQKHMSEYQVELKTNTYIYSNIEDVLNLMHSGSFVNDIKTVKSNTMINDYSYNGVNTIVNHSFIDGINHYVIGSGVTASVDENNESIIGRNNLKLTFD